MTKKELKKQYLNAKTLMHKAIPALREFQEASIEYYGYSYNDNDIDSIIDSVDYATGNLSFEEYCAEMENYKKERG